MIWILGVIALIVLYYWIGFTGIFLGALGVVGLVASSVSLYWLAHGIADRKKCRKLGLPVLSIWHHINQAMKRDEAEIAGMTPEESLSVKKSFVPRRARDVDVSEGNQSLVPLSQTSKTVSRDDRKVEEKADDRIAKEKAVIARWANDNVVATRALTKSRAKEKTHQATGSIQLPDLINFTYKNAEGEIADRDVKVCTAATNGQGNAYVEGYCLEKRANRTFKLDRIIGSLTRAETGEIMTANDWFSELSSVSVSTDTKVIRPPKKTITVAAPNEAPSILFTGFKRAEREAMEQLAENAGWRIRKTVSMTLDYLVIGDNAGPSKLKEATSLGVEIVKITAGTNFSEWLYEAVEAI